MKYVELVDALRREGGVSGVPGGKITTLQGSLPAEIERIKYWIRDAWRDIQTEQTNWRFLFREAAHPIPQYTSVIYPPEFEARTVAEWDPCTARIGPVGHGRHRSHPLIVENYRDMRDWMQTHPGHRAMPCRLSIHPRTEAIHLSPIADKEYEFFYDYWRVPQDLDEDNEEPIMPDRFHMLIVWRAIERYGSYQVAPDVLQRAERYGGQLMSALMHDQLPPLDTDGLVDHC